MQAMSGSDLLRVFSAGVRDMLTDVLDKKGSVSASVDAAFGFLDGITEANNVKTASKFACRSGCSFCCYAKVSVTPVEVLRIANYLKETLSADEYKAVYARLVELDNVSRGLDVDARWKLRRPCALLTEDGMCSVYSVRPLACRSMHSFDASKCEADLYGEQPVGIKLDLEYAFAYTSFEHILAEALHARGITSRVELTAALRLAMESANAEQRWTGGKLTFQAAATDVEADIESSNMRLDKALQ